MKLAKWVESDNIAEDLDEQVLNKISKCVIRDYEADIQSMGDWVRNFTRGEKLVTPSTGTLNEPFEGAADYKSLLMQELSYDFGHRAYGEMLSKLDIVKVDVIGQPKAPPSPAAPPQAAGGGMPPGAGAGQAPGAAGGEQPPMAPPQTEPPSKLSTIADRVKAYMNWQVNYEMPEWRYEQRHLLYQLGVAGTLFKKTRFCPIKEKLVSDVIRYPNFAVNQNTTSIDNLDIFTEILNYSENEVISMQRMKLWLDIDLGFESEGERKTDNEKFLEQDCLYDLDEDGYEEPYTITVHEASKKVVRIVARYRLEDITTEEGAVQPTPKQDQYGTVLDDRGEPEMEIKTNSPIVKIDSQMNITAYRLMPSLDGTFLGLGYYHILCARVAAVNTGKNALLNAGYVANLNGGFMAEDAFLGRGDVVADAGTWIPTQMTSEQLQGAFFPHSYKEPSPTLLALIEKEIEEIRTLGSAVDLKDVVGTNVAASSILIMIEELGRARTSIMQELTRTMGKEFQVMARLNAIYADPIKYQQLAGEQADYAADFAEESIDIKTTADPESDSKTHRLLRGEWALSILPQIKENGGNAQALIHHILKDMDLDYADEVMPMPDQNTQQMMQAASQSAQAASESEKKYYDAQAELALGMAEKNRAEAEVKRSKLPAEIEKLLAQTVLDYEKAESEDVKNMVSKYSAHFESIKQVIEAQQGDQNAQETAAPQQNIAQPVIENSMQPPGVPPMGQ